MGFLQNLLRLQPVSLQNWGLLAVLASSVLITVEIYKAIQRRRAQAA